MPALSTRGLVCILCHLSTVRPLYWSTGSQALVGPARVLRSSGVKERSRPILTMLLGLWKALFTRHPACFQGLCGHLSFQGSLLWASSGLRDGPLQGGGSVCTVGPPLVQDRVGFEQKGQDPQVLWCIPTLVPGRRLVGVGLPVTTQRGSVYHKNYH